MCHSIYVHVRAYQRVCVNVCSLPCTQNYVFVCACMHVCTLRLYVWDAHVCHLERKLAGGTVDTETHH